MNDEPPRVPSAPDPVDAELHRAIGQPSSAFLLVGRRLRRTGDWSASVPAFAIQRAQAEVSARVGASGDVPALADIYAEMAASPFLRDAARAMDEELAVARALTAAPPSDGDSVGSRAPDPALNRYEALLERHALTTGGVSSLLAGGAHLARAAPTSNGLSSGLLDVAVGVAAPVLIGFVAWTLEAAREAGCERVGYVSRDGQILHAIAGRLEAHRPPDERMELVYTHGGRRVWHPAGLTPELLDHAPPGWWLGEGMPAGQPASPLDMLALDARDVPASVLASVRDIWQHPPDQRTELLADLWTQPDLRTALGEVGHERRRLLCRYLTQGGLGEGRWAMVDVGWRGRSAASLNRALRAEGLTTPMHLYFGLIKPDAELTRTGDWAPYLFCRPGPDREAGDFGGGLPSFIEVVCSADHGPVRGFRDGPDGVEPVMDPVDADALEWGIGDVQAAILEVVDLVAPFSRDLGAADLRPALKDLLRLFLHEPDPAEVVAWGTFPFAPDPAGMTSGSWVARWSMADALRWAAQGRKPHSFWPQASRAMTPPAGRWLITARERLGARVSRRAGGPR